MNNFKNYANYYNLLYKDKNYSEEVLYIDKLIKKYSDIDVKNILDLGCGTGKHDIILSQKNYNVTGIDLSNNMIAIANRNTTQNTKFIQGDIRTTNLNKKFDAVISLFHVASYQTENNDFESFLQTAYNHLKFNGILIFDFWYGPAVLTDLPTVKIKKLIDDKSEIIRLSTPQIFENQNKVEVNFEILIINKKTNIVKKITEKHPMRYWFLPEIEYYSKKYKFKIINQFKWMTFHELNIHSWNGVIVLKK